METNLKVRVWKLIRNSGFLFIALAVFAFILAGNSILHFGMTSFEQGPWASQAYAFSGDATLYGLIGGVFLLFGLVFTIGGILGVSVQNKDTADPGKKTTEAVQ
jgi:hypothetical protein